MKAAVSAAGRAPLGHRPGRIPAGQRAHGEQGRGAPAQQGIQIGQPQAGCGRAGGAGQG